MRDYQSRPTADQLLQVNQNECHLLKFLTFHFKCGKDLGKSIQRLIIGEKLVVFSILKILTSGFLRYRLSYDYKIFYCSSK